MKRTKDDYSATVERGNRNSQPDKLPGSGGAPRKPDGGPPPAKPGSGMTSSPRPKPNPRNTPPGSGTPPRKPDAGPAPIPRPKPNPRNLPTTPKKPSKPRYV
jgi:hypothetical protein